MAGGCRTLTRFFYRKASLTALDVAERFADGKATLQELNAANWPAETPTFGMDFDLEQSPDRPERKEWIQRLIENGFEADLEGDGNLRVPSSALTDKLYAASCLAYYCVWRSPLNEWRWQGNIFSRGDWPGKWLVNCVFGNPFHSTYVQHAWRSSACVRLAEVCFYHRTRNGFLDRKILLALAFELESLGCQESLLLGHLRSPEEHVQGCWVIDLILGKH